MIKSLTSLRFFFAFVVFLHHYSIGNGKAIFPEGYLGVNFFFILSGFIISYSYKQKIIEKIISKREFIVARIARIYPLHLLTFLFALILGLRQVIITGSDFLWQQFFLNIALLQSFVPIKEYYFSFNAVSWSISNELFFYLMFPILIVLFTNIKRRRLLLTSLLIVCVYFISTIIVPEQYHHALFYINPLTRIIDFIIGIGIFHVWEHIQLSKVFKEHKIGAFLKRKGILTIIEIVSICVLVMMIILSKEILHVYRYASYYWIPMAMIILCFALSSIGGGWISQILSLKPLVIAGEVSFGFYMLHRQIIGISRKILASISEKFLIVIPAILEFLIVFALVLTASIISFYLFEKPANKWIKKRFGQKRRCYDTSAC
jgi:peptidoglycan/LPS O-acetylase OafA/YrhL